MGSPKKKKKTQKIRYLYLWPPNVNENFNINKV